MNNKYTELQQIAQDNQDRRDQARQEITEYLESQPHSWATTGEPETWELLPV